MLSKDVLCIKWKITHQKISIKDLPVSLPSEIVPHDPLNSSTYLKNKLSLLISISCLPTTALVRSYDLELTFQSWSKVLASIIYKLAICHRISLILLAVEK